jgi:monooxygenase
VLLLKASWRARLARAAVRWRVKPALANMRDLASVRKVFNAPLPSPRGVRYVPATVGGVAGEWVEATSTPQPEHTLLYLHGGGFVGCSPQTHRPLTAAFAKRGFRVFAPDYRLAPEHPFPAGLHDVLAAYRALRSELPASGKSARLVIAGDSAGGNLCLALMLALKDAGEALPDAAALFSPSTDLVGDAASLELNTPHDAMFHGPELEHLANAYMQGGDRAEPLASPLRGDLTGLPPLVIHVGTDEVLRDDSLRLAAKARAAGVRVELRLYPVVPHVWQLLPWLPEARDSLDRAATFLREAVAPPPGPEELDVLIVGAGLSGIGAAVHLQQRCPGKSFALLEARQAIGGTWDLFRYPGVRSDSDMFTLGYRFKPWRGTQAIAEGADIRHYIEETAAEHGVAPFVRYGHRVLAADWSERKARWSLTVAREGVTEPVTLHARFVLFCGGYYRYDRGHRPAFDGEESYRGRLVHPQAWPEDLQVRGKRVAVIGSGATAVTLVPALAKAGAEHVTMVQRSPSYVVARPARDAIAAVLQRWLPPRAAYALVRAKNIAVQMYYFALARRHPEAAKQRLVGFARDALPEGYDVARHFTPSYKPWDQRVCLVPDGDLFATIRQRRVSVATGEIERFTESGLKLTTGESIDADVIVTATGLTMQVLGGIRLSLDGQPVDPAATFVYKGLMYSGVPNLVSTFGYTNSSWTLKADLTAIYACRLLEHMRRSGHPIAVPVADTALTPRPFVDFTSGYFQRALPLLPKQGTEKPWRVYQNYLRDLVSLRLQRLEDGVLRFRSRA